MREERDVTATVAARAGGRPASTWDRPLRLTALYNEHVARGATLAERDGWLIPIVYRDRNEDAATLRQAAGLLDIGDGGKVDVKGADLDAVLATAYPGAEPVGVGRAADLGAQGAAACRLTAEQALILTSPPALAGTVTRLEGAAAARACTHVTDVTSALCGLRVVGPNAPAVLERLTSVELAPRRFGQGAAAQAAVAKVHALIARRDRGGLAGYDLYVDLDLGVYLWRSLLEAGAPLGLRQVGRDAEGALS